MALLLAGAGAGVGDVPAARGWGAEWRVCPVCCEQTLTVRGALRPLVRSMISLLVVVARTDQDPIAGLRMIDGGLDRLVLAGDAVVRTDQQDVRGGRRRHSPQGHGNDRSKERTPGL